MKKLYCLDMHKDSILCAIYNGVNYSMVKKFYPDDTRYRFYRRVLAAGRGGRDARGKYRDLLDRDLKFILRDEF